jgi:hypothetical protein
MKNQKKPCHCYGGFDCPTCNPEKYAEQRKNGTPWTKPIKDKPKKTAQTANDWLKILASTGKGTPDIVPEGFETIVQISQQTGKSVTRIGELMSIATQEGTVEMQLFKPEGACRPIKHYKVL